MADFWAFNIQNSRAGDKPNSWRQTFAQETFSSSQNIVKTTGWPHAPVQRLSWTPSPSPFPAGNASTVFKRPILPASWLGRTLYKYNTIWCTNFIILIYSFPLIKSYQENICFWFRHSNPPRPTSADSSVRVQQAPSASPQWMTSSKAQAKNPSGPFPLTPTSVPHSGRAVGHSTRSQPGHRWVNTPAPALWLQLRAPDVEHGSHLKHS